MIGGVGMNRLIMLALALTLTVNATATMAIRTLMDKVDFERGVSVVHMRKRANAGSDTRWKPR